MAAKNNTKNVLSDEEVRELVIARLSVLSPDTIISLGSEGSFTRDELVKSVERGDEVGEKLAEIQMEWIRSFKNKEVVAAYCKEFCFGHDFTIKTLEGYKCSKCGILQSELSKPIKPIKPKIDLPTGQAGIKLDKRKIDYSFQLLGFDMADWFGKEKQKLIFSLFYKHKEEKLRDAFEICKKRGVKTINYFLGVIKKI